MSYLEKVQNIWSKDSQRIFFSTSAFGKNTYFYPQEAGFFKTQFPYFVERNDLESFLVIVTTKGTGFLEYERKKYTLTKNSVCFIDCTAHHSYYTAKDAPWEFFWIHFYGNESKGYFHQFTVANKSPLVHADDVNGTIQAISAVMELSRRPLPFAEALYSKYITDLLTEIICLTVSSPEEKVMPEPLRYIMQETDKYFTDKRLTLKAFADELHMNNSYLSRQFKRYFGMNFIRFLTLKRLNKAKELLKYTDLPVSAVAELCGFDNAGYFIKVFAKHEALTPLLFRRKCR